MDLQPGDIVVDATFGFGGHSREILKKIATSGKLIAIEKDSEILERAKDSPEDKRITFINGDFRSIDSILEKLKIKKIDKILFDLGISSYHFDESGRGFTFLAGEPLDMRLDRGLRVLASDLVNGLSQKELADLFYRLADEKYSRQVARAIYDYRRRKRIESTQELAEIVAGSKPRFGKIHPATQVFQALRIAVNDELEALSEALPKAINLLEKNGRIVLISFHSGEDRIVKNIFKTSASQNIIEILTKKPLTASFAEKKSNPRSRSAKLRAAQRR